MKIIGYRILNESLIDDIINSDKKQAALLNFIPYNKTDNSSKNPIKSG